VVDGLEFEEAGHGEEIRDEAVDVAVEAIPGDGLLADGAGVGDADGLWEGDVDAQLARMELLGSLGDPVGRQLLMPVAVVEDEDGAAGEGGRGLAGAVVDELADAATGIISGLGAGETRARVIGMVVILVEGGNLVEDISEHGQPPERVKR
jgi:hypothetical protein